MALELGANRPGADLASLQAVPASLQDLLTARLDGLGDAKRVAQLAAVLGREFSLLLSALFDAPAASLDSAALSRRFRTRQLGVSLAPWAAMPTHFERVSCDSARPHRSGHVIVSRFMPKWSSCSQSLVRAGRSAA